MIRPNPDHVNWNNLELTDAVEGAILRALQSGVSVNVACAHAGITRANFNGWMRRAEFPRQERYAAFSRRVGETLAQLETSFLNMIVEAAADDWKAAAWFLERRFPKRWGKKDMPKTVVLAGGQDRAEDIGRLSNEEAAAYFRAKMKMAATESLRQEYESHANALELIQ